MQDYKKFYIDGGWVDASSKARLPVVDPTTEQAFAEISLGDEHDLNRAVESAVSAFPEWSRTDPAERKELLETLYENFKARAQDMAEAISSEMGAPISLAQTAQVGAGLAHLKQSIKILEAFDFKKQLKNRDAVDNVFYEPAGVVGLITPWNWPMNQVMLKVAPALAAGCTVVLKPSEIAPISSMVLAELIDASGFPKGVFNLVNGDGAGVGTWLTTHPKVNLISFTGSTRAGRLIMRAASEMVKPVCLELGGKGANIIFADADEKAVSRGVRQCFLNSGQSCNAPTRMLIERSRYESAVNEAREMAAKTTVGSAHEEGRHIGPVVSEIQYDKIQQLIQSGIDEGATLLAGGLGKPEGVEAGYFVKPTVFSDVTPTMTIFKEEIFGPVLCLTPFKDEAQAIELANMTDYGLTNYVQTEDQVKAARVSRSLRSGMVEINGNLLGPASPFGGVGLSGIGREGGVWGFEEFLSVKAVSGLI